MKRSTSVLLPVLAALGGVLLLGLTTDAEPAPGIAEPSSVPPGRSFLRGVVVSCPRAGQIWGSPAMAESLDELGDLGVEWVAIHPYGWIGRDGEVRRSRSVERAHFERAAAMTERAGVELFWKPHLGYWGSFAWRGAIEFGDDEEAWKRFFRSYRTFIVEQARLAERFGAPLFAVGVELEATTLREREWREVIAAVRAVYGGEIVYAANWDSLDKVPFWDAVDLIGVHAYFPLTPDPASAKSPDDAPTRPALLAAWDGPLESLDRLARTFDRPVLVAEIGYNRSPRAAAEPWAYETDDSPAVRDLRTRLMEVAIERLEAAPHVVGMFWWKWMPGTPNDPGDATFSMRDPEARSVLRRRWAG